jgi:hypothetical protein
MILKKGEGVIKKSDRLYNPTQVLLIAEKKKLCAQSTLRGIPCALRM